MTDAPKTARSISAIFIITLVAGVILRLLGILLNAPLLSWLALAVALGGLAVLTLRPIRWRRRAGRADR